MYVKDIVGRDYKNWKRGDCIFIDAPTGTGKTTFRTYSRIQQKL